jgi:hypothetical protein
MIFHGIHHHSDIKIISREMALDAIEDICLNPTTAHMAEVETAIPAMAFAQFAGHAMPLQGLVGTEKLPAFVHMVLARKRPFLELLLQLLELPGIQFRRSVGVRVCFRVHDTIA